MQPVDHNDYDRLLRHLQTGTRMRVDPAPPPRDRFAVMSCIHANHTALSAVMDFLGSEYGIGPDHVVCLGDVIGYGPDPLECVDAAMQFRLCLMGHHEEPLATGVFSDWGSPSLQRTVEYAIRLLRPRRWFAGPTARRRWEFMRSLPPGMERSGDWLFVHGSPRDPTMEHIHKVDTEAYFGEIPPKIREIFSMIDRPLFVGHTHVPGLITEDNQYFTPADLDHEYELPIDHKVIVNVGSVGFPRDKDPKACVVVVDEATRRIRWHRIAYDVAAVAARIRSNPELDNRLADRLMDGL